MKWEIVIDSLPNVTLNILLTIIYSMENPYSPYYGKPHDVRLERILREKFDESYHIKLYHFAMSNNIPIQITSFGIKFHLISKHIPDLEFNYASYLESEDIETRNIGISLFMIDLIEKL
jgi:hypothetical protein